MKNHSDQCMKRVLKQLGLSGKNAFFRLKAARIFFRISQSKLILESRQKIFPKTTENIFHIFLL